MSDRLLVDVEGSVARLTIDRVEKRNALTLAMWEALPSVLAGLADDRRVKLLVVMGAGPVFSAGADIGDLVSGADPDDPMAEIRHHNLPARAPAPAARARYRETISSGELAEGVAAFTAKRTPAFPWRD